MQSYNISYKIAQEHWKIFNKKFNTTPWWKKYLGIENWDEVFIEYDKYEILPLLIENEFEFENEIECYLSLFSLYIGKPFEKAYLIERDTESYFIDFTGGKENFKYFPYPHGDYVLFDFGMDNYIFIPPNGTCIYVFGLKLKKIFFQLSYQNKKILKKA